MSQGVVPYLHKNVMGFYYSDQIDKMLDPISTIISIALLQYKSNDTKIEIKDNKIIYNDPNLWLFQGIYRTYNKCSRQDLMLLYPPLIRSIRWYYSQLDSDNIDDLKNILKVTKKGFIKIKEIYQEDQKSGRLEIYLDHILEKIDSVLTDNLEFDSLDEQISLDDKLKQEFYDAVHKLWSSREIAIIACRFNDIEDHFEKYTTNDCVAVKKYIEMIETVLQEKYQEFKNILIFDDVRGTIIGPHSI